MTHPLGIALHGLLHGPPIAGIVCLTLTRLCGPPKLAEDPARTLKSPTNVG